MLNGWDTLVWDSASYSPKMVVTQNTVDVSGMIVGGAITNNTILCELGVSVEHRHIYINAQGESKTPRRIYISPSGQVKINDTRGFESSEIYHFDFSLIRI